MSSSENWYSINDFFLGAVSDKQSELAGAALNIEEIDIFENRNFMQAEWSMNSTFNSDINAVYDFSENKQDDDFWVVGGGTYVDIGDFDPTGDTISSIIEERSQPSSNDNVARINAEMAAYETSENSDLTSFTEWVYFSPGDDGGTARLERYNITDDDAPVVVQGNLGETAGESVANGDAPVIMRTVNGELYVLYSNTINKVSTDGTYTNRALVLPEGFECVDLTSAGRQSESMFVLCQPLERTTNKSRGYWIDLANLEVQDYLDFPYGGAQWVENIGSDVIIAFVEDGKFRVMRLSQPFPGATAEKIRNIKLNNVLPPQSSVFDNSSTDNLEVLPSPSRSVHTLNGEIHFLLNKDDAPGIYSISRIDPDVNYGIRLEHKLPGDYPNQLGLSMGVYGNKKIVSYIDGWNGTAGSGSADFAVVEPDDSGTVRSSNAVYESVWFSFGDPLSDKSIESLSVVTEPLPANTEIKAYVAQDFESGYDQVYLADGSNMNETNSTYAEFKTPSISKAKTIRCKLEISGNNDDTPRVSTIGMFITSDNYPAHE